MKLSAYLAALKRERAGYEAAGRTERVKDVTAEIARVERMVKGGSVRETAVSPPRERA